MSVREDFRSETTVLRHTFASRTPANRPHIVEHYHDVENCDLCVLLNVAETAKTYERLALSFRAGTGADWSDVDAAKRKALDALAAWEFAE